MSCPSYDRLSPSIQTAFRCFDAALLAQLKISRRGSAKGLGGRLRTRAGEKRKAARGELALVFLPPYYTLLVTRRSVCCTSPLPHWAVLRRFTRKTLARLPASSTAVSPPRLQAQSFVFHLHCVCICHRRLSDFPLSAQFVKQYSTTGFRCTYFVFYPMYLASIPRLRVRASGAGIDQGFHALILLSSSYRNHILLHKLNSRCIKAIDLSRTGQISL